MTSTPTSDRAVGVRDVAAHAGVSRQTVSRVLNDHPEVATATKDRVLAAMQALGYRMNNAARALGTRRTHTIGVLVSRAMHYGPASSLSALEAAARAAGYWVSAAFAEPDDDASVTAALDHLMTQGVEGVVVIAPHAQTLRTLAQAEVAVPVVTVQSAGRGTSGLSMDHAAGARLATAALADAGHAEIAHVAGPADWLEAEARAEGFRTELAERALRPAAIIAGDWSARSGYAAAAAVLASGATAVFAANDQMALGLVTGLHEAGVRVPHDVSVVGFDDAPDAEFFWPRLTTVRQDFTELAQRAIAAVIEGEDAATSDLVPQLVVRDSIAPPRTSAS